MTEGQRPLPYLIEMRAPPGVLATIRLPDAGANATTVVHSRSFGDVKISFDDVLWDLPWEVQTSLADLLPDMVDVAVTIDPGKPVPDLLRANSVHIVSDHFRQIIEPLVKDCEFLPARLLIKRTNSEEVETLPNFFWMNCWNRVDCIDWNESDLYLINTEMTGRYAKSPARATAWKLLKLRFYPADAMFGIIGVKGGARYISPELHSKLASSGLTLRFLPIMFNFEDPSVNDERVQSTRNLNPNMLR